MNSVQKTVLQRYHQQLAEDIMMTEDLFGALYQKKVFELKMIDTIKSEKTPLDQVYKMLSMLPRRGPDAFDSFIEVINGDYPWLASKLEASYKTMTELVRNNSATSEIVNTARHSDTLTSRNSVSDFTASDPDIKSVVGTFIHKHFGQSKRISQVDKKSMEKFLTDQLQKERRRLKSQYTVASDEGQDTVDAACSTSPSPGEKLMIEEIDRMYSKAKAKNDCEKFRFENDLNNNRDDESPCSTPDFTLLQKLEGEIDLLIQRITRYEDVISQCYYTLGETDFKHSLTGLLKDLKISSQRKDKELSKEKAKIEEMLTELYDFSKTINKHEMKAQQQRHQIEANEEEIQKLKRDIAVIADKCRSLEAINAQHAEKEKTLENLRKMVENLKSSTTAVDENANYRNNRTESQRPYRRPYRTTRRGSIENHVNTTIRRNISKPAVNRRKTLTGRQIDTFRY